MSELKDVIVETAQRMRDNTDGRVKNTEIHEAVQAQGYDCSYQTVTKYVREELKDNEDSVYNVADRDRDYESLTPLQKQAVDLLVEKDDDQRVTELAPELNGCLGTLYNVRSRFEHIIEERKDEQTEAASGGEESVESEATLVADGSGESVSVTEVEEVRMSVGVLRSMVEAGRIEVETAFDQIQDDLESLQQ